MTHIPTQFKKGYRNPNRSGRKPGSKNKPKVSLLDPKVYKRVVQHNKLSPHGQLVAQLATLPPRELRRLLDLAQAPNGQKLEPRDPIAVEEFLRIIIGTEAYIESARARVLAGRAPHLEQFALHHAYGKPPDQVEVTGTIQHQAAIVTLEAKLATYQQELIPLGDLPPSKVIPLSRAHAERHGA